MKAIIRRIALGCLFLAGLAAPAAAAPLETEPFDSVNQSPLVRIFGLPGAGNFLLLAPGRTEMGLNTILSNNHTVHDNAREEITLDGETAVATITARHGLFPRFEVSVKIPYVSHSGGFLDGFIDGYHRTFGFREGGRNLAPRNRLLYRYRRDGSDRVLLDTSGSGIGDLALTAAWQLYQSSSARGEKEGLVLNMSLKPPTGDSDELRGSGSTDIALWLTGGAESNFEFGKWTSYGALGMLFLTEGKVLPEQQKNWAAFGSLGLAWRPLNWLAFKIQADAHTPLYSQSDLKELSAGSVQLITGGTLYLSEKTSLDIGVGEDLVVNTAPDVSFHLTLRSRF